MNFRIAMSLLFGFTFLQSGILKNETISIEATVVSIQRGEKDTRLLVPPSELADLGEVYMVRVDHWPEPRKEKYILVEYLHQGGNIDYKEFDEMRWELELERQTPTGDEECHSWIARIKLPFRPTVFGATESLPNPVNLSCYLVTKRPIPIPPKEVNKVPDAASLNAQELPVITLRRTACFGTCPVYSLEIFESGRIHYRGEQYVAVSGPQDAEIYPSEVKALVDSFMKIDYFHLRDVYRTHRKPDGTTEVITDLPTTYTSLRIGGRSKSVEDYAFSPPQLWSLEEEIDRVTNTHRWIHSEDDLKDWHVVEADVYRRTKPGLNVFMQLAGKGDTAGLRKEYHSGLELDAQDETGWTALMLAAAQLKEPAVRQLLEWNAKVDLKDKHGDDALFGAASAFCNSPGERKAQVDIMKLLISHGADPNRREAAGLTPLMVLTKYGNAAAARALLDAGARLDTKDNEGQTALDHAKASLNKYQEYAWAGEVRGLVNLLEKEANQAHF